MNIKLLKNIIKNIKKNQNNKNFDIFFDKYNSSNYSDKLAKQNPQYARLSDKGKLLFNAKAAQGNASLFNQNRPLEKFQDLIKYEMDRGIPYNELTDADLNILQNKAEQAYINSRMNYEDYFDSPIEGIEHYLNEFIRERTGIDLKARELNNELRKLSKEDLNKYTEDTFGQFFDKPTDASDVDFSELDGINTEEFPYDKYLNKLSLQQKELDNLLSTGGFDEKVRKINPKEYKDIK